MRRGLIGQRTVYTQSLLRKFDMKTQETIADRFFKYIWPLILPGVLVVVQWATIQEKISTFEKVQERQTKLIEKTEDALVSVKTDLSYIKGRMGKEVIGGGQ